MRWFILAKTITPYMIRQEVVRLNNNLRNSPQYTSTTGGDVSNEINFKIEQREIVAVKNNSTFLTKDGVAVQVYDPLPGLTWNCNIPPNTDGVAYLSSPLSVIVLTENDIHHCIGFNGDNKDIELVMKAGDTEFRLNKTFINIVTKHLVKNGVEE